MGSAADNEALSPAALSQRHRAPTITLDDAGDDGNCSPRSILRVARRNNLPATPDFDPSSTTTTLSTTTVDNRHRGLSFTLPQPYLDIPTASSTTCSITSSPRSFFFAGTDASTLAPSLLAPDSRRSSKMTLVGGRLDRPTFHNTDEDAAGKRAVPGPANAAAAVLGLGLEGDGHGHSPGNGTTINSSPFAFSADVLADMIANRSLAEFLALGGLSGIARGLRTDCAAGLSWDETSAAGLADDEEAHARVDHLDLFHHQQHGQQQQQQQQQHDDHGPWDGPRLRQARERLMGSNRVPERKTNNVFQLMLLALNDKVLILLSVVAGISLALGLYQTFGQPHDAGQPRVEWVDGVTIMAAVVIVVVAGALNDYQKEQQFARLNRKKDDRMVKAVRSGKSVEISIFDVLAGDILHLEPGDLVPADGILVSGHNVRADESSITGESDQIKKIGGQDAFLELESGRDHGRVDPFIVSGSKILEGMGTYLVTGVGINSAYGRLKLGITERMEPTPLQQKLSAVADRIAMAGVFVSALLFFVLTVKFLVRLPGSTNSDFENAQIFLRIFICSITVVVIAVPEGLPLAVTLALAIAVTRMLKDNNLVRILASCETMGNVTTVCSDKTGTLTMNKMHVTAGIVSLRGRFSDQKARTGGVLLLTHAQSSVPLSNIDTETEIQEEPLSRTDEREELPTGDFVSSLSEDMRTMLVRSVAVNSTAFDSEEDGRPVFIGSKTESALLTFAAERLGMASLQEERANAEVVDVFPFDSKQKCMATVVRLTEGAYRMYVKGAPEILLGKSSRIVADATEPTMEEAEMTEARREGMMAEVDGYASQALRTLALAYRDFFFWPPPPPPSISGKAAEGGELFRHVFRGLTFLAVLCIQDPLRPGVEEAVATCKHAGVFVRMVTGDNAKTAKAIAAEARILTEDGVCMEGPEFRSLSDKDRKEILPRLQVLARSSPDDKKLLVQSLKDLGETVAVTGDGTNDGPALRAADVGFSMGIAGTEVTKEASSIVLMDDDFSSIVKAIEWGRGVNDVIKKFLQFQLTVNITAVILTFVSAITSDREESILTPVQLLWVNLIMDTFAALALATDPPHPDVLDRQPERKTAPLISLTSWKMIIGQSIFQLVVTLILDFCGDNLLGYTTPEEMESLETLVFNTYIWMQFFNLWNNRRLDNKLNIFEGITRNIYFIAINLVIICGQVLIIFFGGSALSATRLSATQWGISLLLGVMSIPVGVLVRLVPDDVLQRIMALGSTDDERRRCRFPPLVKEDEVSWYQAVRNVRYDLVALRQSRSSRVQRLCRGFADLLQGKLPSVCITGACSDDDEAALLAPGETTPLLSRDNSGGISPSRCPRPTSAFAPAAVMAGMVAGSVAGWPSPEPDAR